MILNKYNSLFAFLLCILSTSLSAQNDAAYLLLDSKIGLKNTMLFNGVQSLDPDVTINEKNKYLYSSQDFSVSSIVYENNYYPNVQLKFNVYDDLVLVKIPVENKFSTFQLITSRIQKFKIKGTVFENIGLQSNKNFKGFYENLFENSSITLFKKHKKNVKRILNRRYAYYEFEPTDSEYIFRYKGKFYPANSRKELISVFSSQKAEIKKYYRNQRSISRSEPDVFMVQLFKDISSQLEKSK